MAIPKEDAEALMNNLLPLAEKMLREHGEFYPYGGYMKVDGEIVHVGAKIDDAEHPASQPLIDLLRKSFQEEAKAGEYRATAIVFDVRIKPPGSEEKTDAIQVCLDHRENYSVNVLFPYKISDGKLLFGKNFAQRGSDEIFAK